jgi:hypothetical protein
VQEGFLGVLRAGRAEGGDGAVAVGEEGRSKRDGGVEVLADEEVAVIEGGGGEFDEELAGSRGGDCGGGEL